MNPSQPIIEKIERCSLASLLWSWSLRKGILAFVLILGIIPIINAQSSGSRGGIHTNPYENQTESRSESLAYEKIEDFILVDSKIELRVKPDQIRIVLAVGGDGPTSSECADQVFQKVDNLKSSLIEIGVKPEDLVDDFIAVLPRYQYFVDELNEEKVAVEKLVDYSMQTNLHIKVPDDAMAMRAIRAAFQLNITDIIAFDYWSQDLDARKQQALETAISRAKEKAKRLLGATFDELPAPINVKSSTKIIMPESLYETFANTHSQTLTQNRRTNNLPVITAFRPKNTYYRGYFDRVADQQPNTVPMSCEISIVSTVELFYASPAIKQPARRTSL